jgi:tRNA (mo5U34)-methyltransferase
MNADQLKQEAAQISWFHTMDLGQGVVTPGVDDTPRKLGLIAMPEDLSGKSVLDIGAWDGFFSFEAERRGAQRVVALDSYCWSGEGWGSKAGFELARKALDSRVEDVFLDVMDISPDTAGTFDLVLCLGVLYHLKYPLAALEKVAGVTRDHLILETEVDLIPLRTPAMAFYPEDELNCDSTNWWAPNPAALAAMLKTAGFRKVTTVCSPRSPLYRCARAMLQFVKKDHALLRTYRRDRMIVHAWK